MATNHGNHTTKFVGLRGQIGSVDPCTVLVILDRSHPSFRTQTGRYNKDNPGWFTEFVDNASRTNLNNNFGSPRFLNHSISFPNIQPAINELLNSSSQAALSKGWLHRQNGTGWVDLGNSKEGIVYPVTSIHRGDSRYQIENHNASDWFTRANSWGGAEYEKIVNIHGNYTGEVTLGDARTGFTTYGVNTSMHESGGWSTNIINLFGNLDLTVAMPPEIMKNRRTGLFRGGSDDIQTQVNIFGNVTLRADHDSRVLLNGLRGHSQLNIMPGASLRVLGSASMAGSSVAVIVWGNGVAEGNVT